MKFNTYLYKEFAFVQIIIHGDLIVTPVRQSLNFQLDYHVAYGRIISHAWHTAVLVRTVAKLEQLLRWNQSNGT